VTVAFVVRTHYTPSSIRRSRELAVTEVSTATTNPRGRPQPLAPPRVRWAAVAADVVVFGSLGLLTEANERFVARTTMPMQVSERIVRASEKRLPR
jgi:hypothetical protein